MGVLSQFVQGMGPMVQQGVMPMGVAKSMLLAMVRRFRFGQEVEKQLMKIPDNIPPQNQGDAEKAKLELEGKKVEAGLKKEQANMDMEFKKEEHKLKMAELATKQQIAERKARLDIAKADQMLEIHAKEMAMQAMMPPPAPARPQQQQGRRKGGNGANV
jgi:hypothetical protein